MIGRIGIFDALADRMTRRGRRGPVPVHDIANSQIPGFVSQHLRDSSFGRLRARRPASVQPAHLRGAARKTARRR